MGAKEMFALADYSTDDWGADADYRRPEREGNDQVFVHHPGSQIREAADGGSIRSEKAVLRDIESSAMRRGWWGIQYDIIVGQSGKIYMGRGLARSGATSGDVDDDGTHNNEEGEAVLVLCRPETTMTDKCKASLRKVLDAHGGDVYGHTEAGGTATSCPGDDRMAFIQMYRTGVLPDAPDRDDTEDAPPPTSSKTWTEKIMADLGVHRKGDKRNRQVIRIQALLNSSKMFSLKEDGFFGPKTERAVEEYQQHFRLAVDGIVGPNTWRHLLTSKY